MMLAAADLHLWYAWVAVGLLGAFMSAVFSGVETGVYCISQIRLRLRIERGDPAAQRLQGLLRDRNHFLAVVLIGNNLANYLTTLAATAIIIGWTASVHSAELICTLAVTPILFVFGEMVPKNLFQRFADRITYRWVRVLAVADRLFTYTGLAPLVASLARGLLPLFGRPPEAMSLLSVREQVRGMLLETATLGTISPHQTQIAENVLRMGETRVADVMTPLARVKQLPSTAPYDALLSLARSCPHSRLLIHKPGRPQHTLGVLNVVDALLAGRDGWEPEKLMAPPAVLSPNTPMMAALRRMQQERIPLAVVAGPAGRSLGIVTLKDLVEEIVGELRVW